MKHAVPKRRNPYDMLQEALDAGWQSVDTIPLKDEGEFLALTMSGLIRVSRNRRDVLRIRKADSYGPERVTVNSVDTGNYLGAIAWKRSDQNRS